MSDGLNVHDSIYSLGDSGIETKSMYDRLVEAAVADLWDLAKQLEIEQLTFHWTMTLTEFWAWLKQRIGRVRR